jgi:hypothetical protein
MALALWLSSFPARVSALYSRNADKSEVGNSTNGQNTKIG